MKSLFLVLAAFLVCIPRASAEKVWTSYTLGNAVQDIAILDHYLWGATPVGPVRWNLRDMTYEIMNNIPDNRINCLAVTPQGDMWFGTKGGLFLLKHGTGIFLDMSDGLKCFGNICRYVTALAIAHDGTVWVSAFMPEGESPPCAVAHYTGNGWESIQECIGSIPKIGIGLNDVVWWIRSGHLYRYDGTDIKMLTQYDGLPTMTVTDFSVDRDGAIWVGYQKNVYRYDEVSWTSYPTASDIRYLQVDENGVLWAETLAGLYRLAKETWELYPVKKGSPIANVKKLIPGDNDILWVASALGLMYVDQGSSQRLRIAESLPMVMDLSVTAASSKGTLWFVSGAALTEFDGRKRHEYIIPTEYLSTTKMIKINSENDVYILTSQDIVLWDGNSWSSCGLPAGIVGKDIKGIEPGPGSTVWLNTNTALFRYRNGAWEEYPDKFWNEKEILTLAIGIDGQPVIGALETDWMQHKMPYRLVFPDKLVEISFPRPTDTFPTFGLIKYATDGSLYGALHVSAHEAAVFRFDTDKNVFQSVGTGYGLFQDMDISPDKSVWLGSNQNSSWNASSPGGLYHMSQAGVTRYNEANGLLNNIIRSVEVASNGTVWVGHPDGITRYGEAIEPTGTSVDDKKPASLPVLTNHPNPFNPSTSITFSLPDPERISLIIYDITGQKVRTIASGRKTAGQHIVSWDGRNDTGQTVAAGVYLSRLIAGKYTATGKMLLLK